MAILILLCLIILLILGNFEKIIYLYYLLISTVKFNLSRMNLQRNIKKGEDKSKKVYSMNGFEIFTYIFKIDSSIKLYIFSIIFIILFLNLFEIKAIRFILVEILIVIITINIIQFLKNSSEIFKMLFGHWVFTIVYIFITITFFQLDLENNEFSIPIFLMATTLLIAPLFISLNIYYSASNRIYRMIHFILCLINIIVIFFLMLTYIGYGFMFYELKDLHVNVNNGRVNVYNQITERNGFLVLITYGLDKLSNIDIQVGGKDIKESIGFGMLLFSIVGRTIVSTYVALVFAFITNTLVSRGSKDKN